MKTLKFDKGDLVLSNGRFEYVEGREKLGQLIGEILLIEKMENGFGAGIVNALGSLDAGLIEVLIRDSIKEFAKLQRSSAFYTVMDKSELVGEIGKLNVYVERSNVAFELEVNNQEKEVLEIRVLV